MKIYALVQSKELARMVDSYDPYYIYTIYFYELTRIDTDQVLIWKYFDYFYIDSQYFISPVPYVESYLKTFGYPYLGIVESRPQCIPYEEHHFK